MYRASIGAFVKEAGKVWWAMIPSCLGTAIGFVQWFTESKMPPWISWAVAAFGLLVAAFVAFHRERMARIAAEQALADEKQIAIRKENDRRGAIAAECVRLEAIGAETKPGWTFTEYATAAGAVVFKLRALDAFSHNPALEELIDVRARGQATIQISANPREPRGQPEYQAFWEARASAAKHFNGRVDHIEPSADSIASGCTLIVNYVRIFWGIQPVSDTHKPRP